MCGIAALSERPLVAKQVHWNVVGPRFRSVYLRLDEVVDTARRHSDTVAERAFALGVNPDGRSGTVAKTTAVESVTEGWVKDVDAVKALVRALGVVIGRMRGRIEETGDPAPVSQDILIALTADLEKHACFRRRAPEPWCFSIGACRATASALP